MQRKKLNAIFRHFNSEKETHTDAGVIEEKDMLAVLLSRVLLVLIILGGIITAAYTVFKLLSDSDIDIDLYIAFSCIAILLLSYVINKTGRYYSASLLSVITITTAVFLTAIPSPSPGDIRLLYLLCIPILFSSMLLPFSHTFILTGIISVTTILFAIVNPQHFDKTPVFTTFIIAGMVLLSTRHNILIERLRREKLKQSAEHYKYLASHDSLTTLPNRTLVQDRIYSAIARADRKKELCAICFMDLDNFKEVNDAFGHSAGDELLRIMATRLTTILRSTDTIARMGGDEFILIIEHLASPVSVLPVIYKISKEISAPCIIRDKEILVTTTIGISFYPQDGDAPEQLLQNADTALYHAKGLGKHNYSFFKGMMVRDTEKKLVLARELEQAVKNKEFFLLYQPQVDPDTGEVIGTEALIRWQHPEKGVLSPNEFIPVAEETGLIGDIGTWALKTACHQLRKWHDAGLDWLRVSVNVAEAQIRKGVLLSTVDQALEESGIPPHYLELELTENILFKETEASASFLTKLKKRGVRIAVDDFGAGYSTLRQLTLFPIDVLKVDRRFAIDVASNRKDAAVVGGILYIAQKLGFITIAEGIETPEQLEAYHRLGFDLIQGFLFSPPLPPDSLATIAASTCNIPAYNIETKEHYEE